MVIQVPRLSGQQNEKTRKFSEMAESEKIIHRILEYWTPKDREAWLDLLVKLVKQKTCINYMNDHDLRMVISAARHTIGKKFNKTPAPYDPDLPECYYWDEAQVADWISENGHPELREAFLMNHISGRKLVAVDASALSKMGLRYFDHIKDVAAKIRQLLGIPRPNMMRALMRLVPMEMFLRKRLQNGRTHDLLTFQKFCANEGLPYDYLLTTNNKNALVPCTLKLMLYFDGGGPASPRASSSSESSENMSLVEAPTVEFVARSVIIRNRILEQIFDNVLTPAHLRKYGLGSFDSLSRLLDMGLRDLGLLNDGGDGSTFYGRERLEFAAEVGKNMVREMIKTTHILQDIQRTRRYLGKNISTSEYEDIKLAADIFLEDAMPIAALLSLGELDLDEMFRQEQEIRSFVFQDVVEESEEMINELVPESQEFIEAVITEAKLRVVSMLYPDLSRQTIRSASSMVKNLLDDLIETAISNPDLDQGFQNDRGSPQGHIMPLLMNSVDLQLLNDWKKSPPRRKFTLKEKFDPQGNPILDRLDSNELLAIIETGHIPLAYGSSLQSQEWVIKAKEEYKRQLQDLQIIVQQQVYRRRHPGHVNLDDSSSAVGGYQEYTQDEKIDEIDGNPQLEKLTMDELEAIIESGTWEVAADSLKFLDSEVVLNAKMEKRRRDVGENLDKARANLYQKMFPGRTDSHGIFHEFIQDEKYDSLGLPVVERLNMVELDHLIKTGEFKGVNLSSKSEGETMEQQQQLIIERARMEKHEREQEQVQAQIEQETYRKLYPGKMDDGIFKEWTKKEKYPDNHLPMIDKLNIEELDVIHTSGVIVTADGRNVQGDAEFLHLVKTERDKREQEQVQGTIQQKVYRMRPNLFRTRKSVRFSQPEKFDGVGNPIFERLTNEELDDMMMMVGDPERLTENLNNDNEDDDVTRRKKKRDEAQAAMAEKTKRITEQQELREAEEYLIQFPEPLLRGQMAAVLNVMDKRPQLQDYLDQFDEDKIKVDNSHKRAALAAEKHMHNLVEEQEQMRLEALEAIRELIEQKNMKEAAAAKEEEPVSIPLVANLALFNGFVIDDLANVIGTVDPFDGHVRNKNGETIGVIQSTGILFTNEGNSLGKVGADIEQTGIGKFRALPKNVESLDSSSTKRGGKKGKDGDDDRPILTTAIFPEEEDGEGGGEREKILAKWNADQAQVKRGLLMQKGDEWVRQSNYVPKSDAANTRLALQIQQTEGYKQSQVILLDSGSIEKLQDELKQQKESDEDDDNEEEDGKRDEDDKQPFVWKRAEKKQKNRQPEDKKLNKPLTARMLKGEAIDLTLVTNKKEVPVRQQRKSTAVIVIPPGSTGKWGVQEVPVNPPQFHEFKPPPPPLLPPPPPAPAPTTPTPTKEKATTSSSPEETNSTESPPKVHDMLAKVHTGEAKKLISAKGTAIGEIKKDGQIFSGNGDYVGYIQNNGIIVLADGTPMKEKGVKVIRQNGVVLGEVNDKGKLNILKDTDRFLLGMIWGDGRIVTVDNVLVGVVMKDGRILGSKGKPIGLFTPTWEILGTDGVPFAYVTSEGYVYRYEVIPQARYLPTINQLGSEDMEESEEAVVLFTKEGTLTTAFEMPPTMSETQSSHNFDNQPMTSLTAQDPGSSTHDDYDKSLEQQRLQEKEKARQLELEMRQYDLDESHKHARPHNKQPSISDLTDALTSTMDHQLISDTGSSGGIKTETISQHDHRVARMHADYLKEKQIKRQHLVDKWANQIPGNAAIHGDPSEYVNFDPEMSEEDKKRVVNLAADTIIDDIFKLALTHLLLQAEAGHNTKKIMECLANIQTTATGDDDDHTQLMWQARLSQVGNGLQVFKRMANLLPSPGDKGGGVHRLVQQLLRNKQQVPIIDTQDKGIQHDAKADFGMTVNLPPPTVVPHQKQDLKMRPHRHRPHHHQAREKLPHAPRQHPFRKDEMKNHDPFAVQM